jgi:hypothetical protein
MSDVFTIGNWNDKSPILTDRVQGRLRAKAMRDRKRSRFELLCSVISEGPWAKHLVDSRKYADSILGEVRDAWGCTDKDEWPSASTVRRAVGTVIRRRREVNSGS